MADHPAELMDIVMPRRERQILQFFIERKIGTVFPKQRVFDHVYGGDPEGGPNCGEAALWSHVSKLNAKLEPLGWRVKSHRFDGYWLEKLDPKEADRFPRPRRIADLERRVEALEALILKNPLHTQGRRSDHG